MNIKGFRRMLFGEKMPDKNDPKYKDRYEREVSAGRKFAQATRIDKAAAKVQGFANAHRILFWSSSLVSLSEGSLGTSIALQWHTATAGRHARRRKCRIRCYGKDTRGCKGVK